MISVLVFSKDRPLQLDGYLRSIRKSFYGEDLNISVLYKRGNDRFCTAYASLVLRNDDVNFIVEKDFKNDVMEWLDNVKTELVFFGCDDVVFNGFYINKYVSSFFNDHDNTVAFSMRLGKNIIGSLMSRGLSLPPFYYEFPYLFWKLSREVCPDWNYGFELDGTIYRKDDISKLLKSYNFRCPNTMEGNGVKEFHSLYNGKYMGSFIESILSVVTVNRVQDKFNRRSVDKQVEKTPEELLDAWNNGMRLDINKYWTKTYDRIHISDLFMRKQI